MYVGHWSPRRLWPCTNCSTWSVQSCPSGHGLVLHAGGITLFASGACMSLWCALPGLVLACSAFTSHTQGLEFIHCLHQGGRALQLKVHWCGSFCHPPPSFCAHWHLVCVWGYSCPVPVFCVLPFFLWAWLNIVFYLHRFCSA